MLRKPADVIADNNVVGPGAVFLVDGNNNLVIPASSSASDAVASGNLTSASGAGSTVQLQLGEGQATWEAQLTGTFSGGTTIAFQGSDDASSPTNWQSAIGYNSALTNPVFITQISGPGPFIIRGPASGYQFIQMVCTALHSGDNVAVRLIGSTGAMAGGGPVNIPDGGNTVEGTTTDTNTVNTMMGRLTKIRDLLNATLTVGGTVTANIDATNSTHLGNIDTATSDLVADLDTLITNTAGLATQATLASVKTDLDTLVTNTADLLSDGDNLATIATNTGNSATVEGATNDAAVLGDVNGTFSARLRGLSKILNNLIDTFGANTAISAQTSLAAIPTAAGLVTNSYATLTNASYQDTFIVQINVASAFVGTIGFYGLLPDGTTLQPINAHQRATAINGNSTAINTSSALEQTWEGSIAAFKAIYVICSAFTSGAASVQLGLTAANYAHAILNTVASNITQVGGVAPQLDGSSSNRLGISNYVTKSVAGDTALTLGQATQANSIPVTNASDQTPKVASTVTKTSVAASVSDTAILASNSSRKGGKFYNDSTAICYLSEGSGSASTTSYTVQIPTNGFYEIPPEPIVAVPYRAVWSAANGNLRITENT